jgi:hypothetical protein
MTFETTMRLFMHWSTKTFAKATAMSSLDKLQDEIEELRLEITFPKTREALIEEYVDCLMCILHSADKSHITVSELVAAFERKFIKNYESQWKENPNHTYSRVKN